MEYTGVKIYSNSFSSHIKDEYRTLVSYGIPAEEAEELIITHYKDYQDGYYRGPFWLGLARVETDTGRLSQRVKEEALAVMADGSDLELWRLGLELEPDYREANRRGRMERARNKAILSGVLAARQSEYERTTDEVRRAQIRTEQTYFSLAVNKLVEQAEKEVLQRPKRIPPSPPDDGWEPSPLLDWDHEEVKFLHEYGFGPQDDSLRPRLPDKMICRNLLGEIMSLDGSMEKKLKRRIGEHEALRTDMEQPQVPKKVSKPYATPSPWQEGDVFWLQLKELPESYSAWENCYVAYRVISVRGRPISVVYPSLGRDEDVSLGLYRWVGMQPPDMKMLEQGGYTSWGAFWNVEQKGIWLGLYGELRTVKKWNWKVIGQSPNFSKDLPAFFRNGALYSQMVGFGGQLAWETVKTLSKEGLAPIKVKEIK